MESPSLRQRLDPRAFALGRVDSAWWHWLVNGVAASAALDRRTRVRLLRLAGIEVRNAIIEAGCYFFGSDVVIGDYSMINHRVYFDTRAHIEIGRGAGLAPEVMLCTSSHELGDAEKRWGAYTTAPISIGAGAWLGSRALVLPGVSIGDGAAVAAGAVVTGDVEPNTVYGGVPARRIRDL